MAIVVMLQGRGRLGGTYPRPWSVSRGRDPGRALQRVPPQKGGYVPPLMGSIKKIRLYIVSRIRAGINRTIQYRARGRLDHCSI